MLNKLTQGENLAGEELTQGEVDSVDSPFQCSQIRSFSFALDCKPKHVILDNIFK